MCIYMYITIGLLVMDFLPFGGLETFISLSILKDIFTKCVNCLGWQFFPPFSISKVLFDCLLVCIDFSWAGQVIHFWGLYLIPKCYEGNCLPSCFIHLGCPPPHPLALNSSLSLTFVDQYLPQNSRGPFWRSSVPCWCSSFFSVMLPPNSS